MMATCTAAGVPNLGHLSQVHRVDDHHIAVSNQFLAKSMENLAENPLATLLFLDPANLATYRVLMRHVRTESSGPMFDEVSRSIDAIAAMTGMAGVFALKALEIFRVLDVELVPSRATTRPS